MMQKIESEKKQETIDINGAITICDILNIHKKLLRSIEDKDAVSINLQDVDSCDTSGIQLLFSVLKTGEKKGKKLNLINVSEPIQETAKQIGVYQEILNGVYGE